MTTDPRTPQLIAYGATYLPAKVVPGQGYWRLESAAGPLEYGGRHHIYVDVIGEAGQRLTGVPVSFYWDDGYSIVRTETKPGEDAAANFPMYAAGRAYGVRIESELPSDELFGLGLIAFAPHVSYRLVFRRTVKDGGSEPPVDPPDAARDAIDEAIRLLQKARGLL